jgi:hypothetical protein
MRRSTVFWGAILILAGFLLLLDNLNLLPVKVWDILWPTLLVLLGLWTLVGSMSSRKVLEIEHLVVPLEGAARVNLRVNHGAGRLRMVPGDDLNDLAEGDFSGGLSLRSQRMGDTLEVEMSVPTRNFPMGPWFWGQRGMDWSVALNREIPLHLDIRTGANESDLDLSGLQVTELRLSTGASSTRLVLPDSAGYTRARVEAGAASLNIRIPQNVAGQIRCQGGLASINVDTIRFAPMSSGLYQSPDYDSVVNRVDLEVQAGVGSVDIR